MIRTSDEIVEQAVWTTLDQLDTTSRKLYRLDVFHFLPRMIEATSTDSSVHAAMRANAIVNVANRTSQDMSPLVNVEYHKAIATIKAELADPELFLKDEILVAVWLMSKRDMFVGMKGSALYAYDTHYAGMLTLLKLRGARQFETENGRRLFHFLLAPLNWGPLLTSRAPSHQYLELEAWMIEMSPHFPENLTRIHQYYHGVCTFLAKPTDSAQVQHLETEFETLRMSSIVTAQPVSTTSPFIENRAHCLWYFHGWISFFYWTKLHVACMYLHLSMIALPASRDAFHRILRDFIGVFAYALGDIDDHGRSRPEATAATRNGRLRASRGVNVLGALQIHAPLRHLATSPSLNPHESRAVSDAIARLNAEFRLW